MYCGNVVLKNLLPNSWLSSIRCLHWMDCTSYNVQCALHALILFKLSQLIANFSLDVDVLKNFLRNMLNLWGEVLKVSNFPFMLQILHIPVSYGNQIKVGNHQRKNMHCFSKFSSSWFLPSSILPRCTIMYSCTVAYTVQWQWEGAVTSWVGGSGSWDQNCFDSHSPNSTKKPPGHSFNQRV